MALTDINNDVRLVQLPASYLCQAVTADSFICHLENHAPTAYPAEVADDFECTAIIVTAKLIVKTFNEFAEPLLDQAHSLRFQNERLWPARELLSPRLMSMEVAV